MPRTKNRRGRRRQKLMEADPVCWYCGLGFPPDGITLPPKGTPGWKKTRRLTRPTLEHLLARSKGGTLVGGNCVLAHHWCNVLAADRPVVEKHELRDRLRAAVAELLPAAEVE
jgi:hypothetical protein